MEPSRPAVIVHQTTSTASTLDLRRFHHEFAFTNRLRTDETEYLLAAGPSAGVHKFLVRSYSGWPNERQGGRSRSAPPAKTESCESLWSL
jgi:hypothetical protein